MRGLFAFLSVSTLLLTLSVQHLFAQSYDLDPTRWFPLEVGNYWHYRCCLGPIFTDWILFSERDTLVDGQRWVRFTEVACTGPGCSVGFGRWFRMTDDFYVVYAVSAFSQADTLVNTVPQSIFTVNQARDSTLQLASCCGGAPTPVIVSITENTLGEVADSTHLTLHVTNNGLFDDSYIYNIGRGDRVEVALVGALVNRKAVGDTTWIRGIVRTHVAATPALETALDVYPNPTRHAAMLRVESGRSGVYELSIYNMLGQRVHSEQNRVLMGELWQRSWAVPSAVGSGVYFVRLTGEGGLSETRTLIVLK